MDMFLNQDKILFISDDNCHVAPSIEQNAKGYMAFCLAPMEGVTPEIFGQSDCRTSGRHFVQQEESLLMIATIVIFITYCRISPHFVFTSAQTD